jgi:peptide-methionine (S)-S-oxide reductase
MPDNKESQAPASIPPVDEGCAAITLGAGCFWCTEGVFQQLPGVRSVTSGYMGGTVADPSYEQVCSGRTGHDEVTRIVYDPQVTSLEALLEMFWKMHDPTQLNGQGGDIGTQYRSAIFYDSEDQRQVAEASRAAAAKKFTQPIVTEITAASAFYPAEGYHQDYYRQNKGRNPYCSYVITPKLAKLGLEA